jgi:hypothetical protein
VISSKIEFLRDMYLLFQNAFIFNPKGSDIYVMASTLKTLTKKEMRVTLPSPSRSSSSVTVPDTRRTRTRMA